MFWMKYMSHTCTNRHISWKIEANRLVYCCCWHFLTFILNLHSFLSLINIVQPTFPADRRCRCRRVSLVSRNTVFLSRGEVRYPHRASSAQTTLIFTDLFDCSPGLIQSTSVFTNFLDFSRDSIVDYDGLGCCRWRRLCTRSSPGLTQTASILTNPLDFSRDCIVDWVWDDVGGDVKHQILTGLDTDLINFYQPSCLFSRWRMLCARSSPGLTQAASIFTNLLDFSRDGVVDYEEFLREFGMQSVAKVMHQIFTGLGTDRINFHQPSWLFSRWRRLYIISSPGWHRPHPFSPTFLTVFQMAKVMHQTFTGFGTERISFHHPSWLFSRWRRKLCTRSSPGLAQTASVFTPTFLAVFQMAKVMKQIFTGLGTERIHFHPNLLDCFPETMCWTTRSSCGCSGCRRRRRWCTRSSAR